MKVFNIKQSKMDQLKSRLASIDLIDGQRIGERRFRRVILILIAYGLIYALGSAISTKDDPQPVIAKTETVEDATPVKEVVKVEVVPEIVPQAPVVPLETSKGGVDMFIATYGGRIDGEYLQALRMHCDENTLKSVIAISVAETSMGKKTDRKTNYFGWFKNRDRNYDPSSKQEMAHEICTGISDHYKGVGGNSKLADRYTGGDSTSSWMKNYNWALSQMD